MHAIVSGLTSLYKGVRLAALHIHYKQPGFSEELLP